MTSPSTADRSNTRLTWRQYFAHIAILAKNRATCPDAHVGAVVVKNKRIVSTGYNGAPSGEPHCTEVGCEKFEEMGPACQRIIHAELNSILQNSADCNGATLYVTHQPCYNCMKAAAQAGIEEVVYIKPAKNRERYARAQTLAQTNNVRLTPLLPNDLEEIRETALEDVAWIDEELNKRKES